MGVQSGRAEPTVLWMQCWRGRDLRFRQALAGDVQGLPPSGKGRGLLPVLFDDHQGNPIYRVPRRYPARARVVDTAN